MMWDGYQSGLHWEAMTAVLMALVLLGALLATAGFLLLSGRGGRAGRLGEGAAPDAQAVLDRRFAEGEIDEDEYLRRTAALQQVGHPGITG
ncbi:SHOCT domain-containing protein [Nocardioides iriomotensis]|uniref:SHOCT domain-containing protein n=1 Tax=Nocardioides iriomotensis TaxID=715784 RepID=A0A4Q5J1K6_9ACTN|nr:SHOCT domain-containing protein [Nocardioides iriomotensis]RYU11498.1 SHOCT domain-containing protein [Nocardioides iriomotensis]